MPGGSGEALTQALGGFETEAEADQAELFDVTGALDAPSPMSALFEPKGRGRPKGSRNRQTLATAQWILSQHRHPLHVLAEGYSMTPAELAERIGLKPGQWVVREGKDVFLEIEGQYDNETLLTLFKLQMSWAEAVAPYVAKKQPQDVSLGGAGGDFQLAFVGVSLPAPGGSSDRAGGPVIDQAAFRLPSKSED